jgi:hypothetical protein
MIRVRVTTYGSVGWLAGWSSGEIEVEQATGAGVLGALETRGGGSLLDLLAEGGMVKPTYNLLLNGINLENAEGLQTMVIDEDRIAALDVIRLSSGG